jgi:glycosyltransferase involved in cell wall biosynthesis
MRVLFALPGLHRYDRGAEIAFISLAQELAKVGDAVTLIGSGFPRTSASYRFLRAPSLGREHFESLPSIPLLRNAYVYEESTFIPSFLARYRPRDYDITITCSYPFTNWMLRRPDLNGLRPPHIFVTQNGDWAAYANRAEYRLFGCEGLVCTNPDYYERNRTRWRCCTIPNGVDTKRFLPGPPLRQEFGIPADQLIILMVSALIPGKRVSDGIDVVSRVPDAHLVVAGDGPLRQIIDAKAAQCLPGRFTRITVTPERMPQLYRSSDIFMHLSKEEPFGNVFIEALACGLPVVGHFSPRSRWIVGDEGFLVDTNDFAEVARQIEIARVLNHNKRSDRIARAARFSWPIVSEMYRAFFQEVILTYRSTDQPKH